VVFSPNDISGLRKPKNVEFGTDVPSSTRMIRTIRFLENVSLLWRKQNDTPVFQNHSHGRTTYMQKQHTLGAYGEWILHTRSTEDTQTIVTMLVLIGWC